MVELESSSRYEGVHKLIEATRYVHGDSIAAYICYMAIRLIEVHRVLKPTGSLYLHCDHTANGYIRQLLDGIFGKNNFRNEITWQRNDGRGKGSQFQPRAWGNNTDTILFYAKSEKVRVRPYKELNEEQLEDKFPKTDENGRRYYTGIPVFCSRSMGPRPNLCFEWRGFRNPYPSGWRLSKDKLEEEYQKGNVVIREDGKLERRKYSDDYVGEPMDDFWDDIPRLVEGVEKTGYPTQKPIALAERIIRASSNVGDVVLDCFAGCAYAAVAAEKLGRQWVACDINPRAWTIFKRQFNKPGLALLTCNERTVGQQVQGNQPRATVFGPKQLPKRTSSETDGWNNLLRGKRGKATPAYKKTSEIDRPEMLGQLLKISDYKAWCCGFANRMPDGTIRETTDNFHLDHIRPKSKGGTDRIYNRAPLCMKHNTSKGNREIELEKLRTEIALNGEMLVKSASELIDLDWANDRAMDIFALEYVRQHASESLV